MAADRRPSDMACVLAGSLPLVADGGRLSPERYGVCRPRRVSDCARLMAMAADRRPSDMACVVVGSLPLVADARATEPWSALAADCCLRDTACVVARAWPIVAPSIPYGLCCCPLCLSYTACVVARCLIDMACVVTRERPSNFCMSCSNPSPAVRRWCCDIAADGATALPCKRGWKWSYEWSYERRFFIFRDKRL